MDAQNDFDQAIKLTEGKTFIVEEHVKSVEVQIMIMRQRRAKQQKSIV